MCKVFLRSLLLCLCFLLLLPTAQAWARQPAEKEVPPFPRTATYVAVGDSITAGWGSPLVEGVRQNGYVAQLHRQLLVRGQAKLHNLGVPGLTSGQLLFVMEHWPEMSRLLQQAELITLSIGGNDIIWTEHQSPGDTLKMREALSKYEANITTILNKIRILNPSARLFVLEVYNPFPIDDDRHNTLQPWIKWVNESIAMAANDFHAEVVPTSDVVFDQRKQIRQLGQQRHPSEHRRTHLDRPNDLRPFARPLCSVDCARENETEPADQWRSQTAKRRPVDRKRHDLHICGSIATTVRWQTALPSLSGRGLDDARQFQTRPLAFSDFAKRRTALPAIASAHRNTGRTSLLDFVQQDD